MMRRAALILFCAGLCSIAIAVPPKEVVGPPTEAELAGGQALAERLRASLPDESSDRQGKLIIDSNDVTRQIPLTCRVVVNDTNWETDYTTQSTPEAGAESLTVIHSTNGPNEYLYARGAAGSSALPSPQVIPPGEAEKPFAGSDFSLADLGLDFLHWPVQRRLKGEMRLGQPCYVLESSQPHGGGIVRVRSDIDEESNGLLIAEAYDANGRMVKKFSLHASSFKKVNGHWQVEKMEIYNKKTGSDTQMKFDLAK